MTVNVFAVPGSSMSRCPDFNGEIDSQCIVFFICFRECLETSIIVSVLLSFLKQTLDGPESDAKTYKRLVGQVRDS